MSGATKKITPKQKRFVEEYLIDMNATQAAIRAGYSEKTAEQGAAQLLSNIKVSNAVQLAIAERSNRTKIDADWVLERLVQEADADLAELYEDNGSLKPIHDWPKVWRTGLIGGIDVVHEYETVDGSKVSIGSVTKLKLSDRVRRLELIGKHIDVSAFAENLRHAGKDGGPIKHQDMTDAAIDARIKALTNGAT